MGIKAQLTLTAKVIGLTHKTKGTEKNTLTGNIGVFKGNYDSYWRGLINKIGIG